MSIPSSFNYSQNMQRTRKERSFTDREDLQGYEYREHWLDAQRAINTAATPTEKWERQIIHENR